MKSDLSIIIPCHNDEQYLSEAIESIRAQKNPYGKIEIIVVDDGSTDGSSEILNTQKDIVVIASENHGPSHARNLGIRKASAELIGFLDADDLFPIDKIAQQIKYLKDHLDCQIISGKVKCFGEGDDTRFHRMYDDKEKRTMLNFNLGACLFRKEVFDKIGLLDESLRYSEDVDLWFKIVEGEVNYEFLEEVTLLYRIHETNMTIAPVSVQHPYFFRAIKNSMDRRREKGSFEMPPFFKNALKR